MSHTKTLQLYRNTTIIRPDAENFITALDVAKSTFEDISDASDGEVVLVRYKEGNTDPVKTLIGVYHDNSNAEGWTYFIDSDEFYTKEEIDETEQVIAQSLCELDERISAGVENIPTMLSELGDDSTHRLVTDANKSTWNAKADPIVFTTIATTGNVTQQLLPDNFYIFGTIDSLSLTLGGVSGIYAGKFTTSSNWDNGTKLSVPATVTEAVNNDTTEGGNTYEFSILDNIIVVKQVA